MHGTTISGRQIPQPVLGIPIQLQCLFLCTGELCRVLRAWLLLPAAFLRRETLARSQRSWWRICPAPSASKHGLGVVGSGPGHSLCRAAAVHCYAVSFHSSAWPPAEFEAAPHDNARLHLRRAATAVNSSQKHVTWE